jgi:hypothetical protein
MQIRPNKATWIFGVSAGSKQKPYFPPVVPRFETPLPDIVESLVEAMKDRAKKSQPKIQRITAELRAVQAYQNQDFMTKRQERQLKEELDGLLAIQQKTSSTLIERVRKDALNFSLLKGCRSIHVDGYHTFPGDREAEAIVFTTSPIKIGTVILGTYDVYLDPRETVPGMAFDLIRRDHKWTRGYHPHFTGHPCYGTFGPVLQKMLTNASFVVAIGAYFNYLAVYDARSPLMSIGNFKRGTYKNENPLA